MTSGDRDARSYTPNPGSDEALEWGCRCPIMDNNHGKWAPHPSGNWFINQECPVHATVEPPAPRKWP